MWNEDETECFALASLSPTKWQPARSISTPTISSLDHSFGSESNVSLVPPSPLIKFARRWLESSSSTSRNADFMRIEGGKRFATVTDSDETKRWTYKAADPRDQLANANISTLEVTGVVSVPLVEIITRAKKIDTIKFRRCVFKCRSAVFSSMIRSVSASSITFVGCEFTDTQIIGDRLFAANKQINKIIIRPANKEMLSFPSLTNATLHIWKQTVPTHIHFTNVLTSFSAKALADMSKVIPYRKLFNWRLGTVPTDAFGMGELFSRLPATHVKKVVIISPSVHVLYRNKSVIMFSCSPMELLCSDRIV